MLTNLPDAEARYYLTDDQNSVIATTDHDGDDVIRYLYEPYGQTIRSWTDPDAGTSSNDGAQNATLTTPTVDHNPYRYVSGYTDPDTGLIKFGTRYYTPNLATWTQPDPKNGKMAQPLTMNAYLYAADNPVNKSDPSGRYWGEGFVEGVGDVAAGLGELLPYAVACGEGVLVGAPVGAAVGTAYFGVGAVPGGAVGATYGCAAAVISVGVSDFNFVSNP